MARKEERKEKTEERSTIEMKMAIIKNRNNEIGRIESEINMICFCWQSAGKARG